VGHLDSKVVIVTGAGRGVGRAEALLLAREGARVVVNDLGCEVDGSGADPSIASAVAQEIAAAGGDAVASHDDVARAGTAEKLVELAYLRWGRLDGVIANAGIARERGILHTEPDDLEAFLGTHVRAAFSITRAAAHAMIDAGEGGSIVLTTSPGAYFGAARRSAASAAAAAVVGLARSAAAELRRHRIRVNALAPTARTRATESLPMFQGISEGSMSAEHVAPVAAFLSSDLAADVFGEVIAVAGARVYAIRARETAGAFARSGGFSIDELAAAFPEITRG
jgi:NAD(P)-dependent dehydrogenase (short-subunit alcohol dehydrogenase family)